MIVSISIIFMVRCKTIISEQCVCEKKKKKRVVQGNKFQIYIYLRLTIVYIKYLNGSASATSSSKPKNNSILKKKHKTTHKYLK